ncbi:MAG TPA: hypothetical protein VK923_08060 [Euzebyales bacterium]|nr:hypothetical protein [Euzebyales bacterium]
MNTENDDEAAGPRSVRGFGVASTLSAAVIGELAGATEAAGYRTFWTNDMPDGDGLGALRVAAEATTSIRLGVGLLPVDRVPANEIIARIALVGLPIDRLVVGVGAGAQRGGLARVRAAVAALRGATSAAVVVGALGPRMCRLAGELADGVLLDWPTIGSASAAREHVRWGARSAGRAAPPLAGYVFTALGAAGLQQLRSEAAHYGSVPAYAAHFGRAAHDAIDAAVHAETIRDLRQRLAAYEAVLDEVIVRAVVGEPRAAAYRRVLDAGAPDG